jgi:CrcB protein
VPPSAVLSLDRRELAAIFLGGAAGALLRVGLGKTFSGGAPDAYFATRLGERLPQSTYRRPLLGTGFCGAYTTFSTMQVEILTMLDHDRYGLAVTYALSSVAAGYTAIWVATALVRRVRVLA